jgi:hypothetical protein
VRQVALLILILGEVECDGTSEIGRKVLCLPNASAAADRVIRSMLGIVQVAHENSETNLID